MITTSAIMSSRATQTPSIRSAHMEDTRAVLIQDMINTDLLPLLMREYVQWLSRRISNSSLGRMIALCFILRRFGEAFLAPGPSVLVGGTISVR